MRKMLLAAIVALATTPMAFAEPVKMTAEQLDQVTAGQVGPPFTVTVGLFATGEHLDFGDTVHFFGSFDVKAHID